MELTVNNSLEVKNAEIVYVFEDQEDIESPEEQAAVRSVKDLAQLCRIEELQSKPVVIIARRSFLEDHKSEFFKIVRLPAVVVGILELEGKDASFLKDLANNAGFPVPPFRIFGHEYVSGKDLIAFAQDLSLVAKKLADGRSLLGALGGRWGSWNWASDNDAREGIRIWLVADSHLGEGVDLPHYGDKHLGWISGKARHLSKREVPDIVILLGDLFSRGPDKGGVGDVELKRFSSVLHERLKGKNKGKGGTVFVVIGEHDCVRQKIGSRDLFWTGPIERKVRELEEHGVVSPYRHTLVKDLEKKKREKIAEVEGDGPVWREEVKLDVIHGSGVGVRIARAYHDSGTWKYTREAMGTIHFAKDNVDVKMRIVLLSSFDPREVLDRYVDIKGGAISHFARNQFAAFLREDLGNWSPAVNLVCMHHALEPENMKIVQDELAYVVRGVGDFEEVLDFLADCGLNGGVLIAHGHTHTFHVTSKEERNIIHIGVPALGSKYPRVPHGISLISLVKIADGRYALCTEMCTVRWDGVDNVEGSLLVPLETVVIGFDVDSSGCISRIDKEEIRFKARFSYEYGIPYFESFMPGEQERVDDA